MGTRIDDATQKVTLVGTDKIPLGDGSFLPKYYEVSQIAEYAVSVASAAITSINNQVSILGAARTSVGQEVSVHTAALVSINSILNNSVLSTAQGDARYLSTAEGSSLVEAYGYASVNYVSATYLTKASSSAFSKPAEVCAIVEGYGFTSTNAVSTMISAAQVVSIYTLAAIRSLSAGDQNGYLAWTSSGGGIFTIPACATVPFPIGCQITFRQRNTGKLGVSAAAGVSIQAPSSCSTEARGQGSTFTLIKYTSDTWDITGDLSVK